MKREPATNKMEAKKEPADIKPRLVDTKPTVRLVDTKPTARAVDTKPAARARRKVEPKKETKAARNKNLPDEK